MQLRVDVVNVLFFVEDEVCKLLAVVYKNETVVVISGAVVRLTLAYAGEGTVNVIVRDVVLDAEVAVLHAQLAETDAAYRLRCAIIVNMLLIAYAPFVNAFEFQPAEQCAPPPFF